MASERNCSAAVSVWSLVFLGVIAAATLAIAIVQIGVLVAAGRLARRVDALADQFEREMKPLFGHLNTIGHDASRADGYLSKPFDLSELLARVRDLLRDDA